MALTFGGATTDRVDLGKIIQTPANVTFLLWHFLTTRTNGRRLFGRTDNATYTNNAFWDFVAAGPSFEVTFSGGGATATSSKTYATSKWWFSAFVCNGTSAAPQIFSGDLATAATEDPYSSQTAGTGTPLGDTGDTWNIGNLGTGTTTSTLAYRGAIAVFARVDRSMTLGEIRRWQWHPLVDADTKTFHVLGYNGTGTQPDWSGHANAGTVTGASQSAHVPLGPLYGVAVGWHGAFTAAAGGATPLTPFFYRQHVARAA